MRGSFATSPLLWAAVAALSIATSTQAQASPLSPATLAALALCQPESAPLGRGLPAPALGGASWIPDDSEVSFGDGRITVLGFFSLANSDSLEAIQEHHTLRDSLQRAGITSVDVVAVAVRQPKDAMSIAELVDSADELDFPVCVDGETGAIAQRYLGTQPTSQLPITYVVGVGGNIQWYGDPWRGMFDVVQAVVEGRFDPLAFEANQRAIDRAAETLSDQLEDELFAQDWTRVAKIAGELAKLGRRFQTMSLLRYEAYLHAGKTGRASRYGEELLTQFEYEPAWLNELAWNIVSPATSIDDDRRDLDLATRAAERAAAETDRRRDYILDTLARCYFENGNVERAIQVQREAIAITTIREDEMRTALEEYLQAERDLGRGP